MLPQLLGKDQDVYGQFWDVFISAFVISENTATSVCSLFALLYYIPITEQIWPSQINQMSNKEKLLLFISTFHEERNKSYCTKTLYSGAVFTFSFLILKPPPKQFYNNIVIPSFSRHTYIIHKTTSSSFENRH